MILKYNQKHIATLILSGALAISGFLVAGAQTAVTDIQTTTTGIEPAVNSVASITFPIAELGNCADKEACKTYCDISANAQACLNFAESHRLMRSDDIARARKMVAATQAGGPGGCRGREECQTYCSDSSHADECIAFAEKNGILNAKDVAETRRVLPFLKRGETPGGCKTKEACQTYCADSSHATECINFAQRAGLMSKEEADIVAKTGGRGPNGCTSKDSCETFCNQKENQQVCLDFAKEHNLISEDQLKNIQEGTARLRVGLSQMPGEVVQCLKDKIGNDAVGQIESGRLAPSKDIGDIIQGCFNQFKPQMAAKIQEGLRNASPEVTACLQSSLSADEFQKIQQGQVDTPEIGDKVKSCFEKMREAAKNQMQEGAKRLQSLPSTAQDCIKQKLGSDIFDKLQSGNTEQLKEADQGQIQSVVSQCMTQNASDAIQPGNIKQMPTQEQIRGIMQERVFPTSASGTVTPEQIKEMMEKRSENNQENKGTPTPEQIRNIMQRNTQSITPGTPRNIPPTSGQMGPTPEQIKEMMQKQVPTIAPQVKQPIAPQIQIAPQPTDN